MSLRLTGDKRMHPVDRHKLLRQAVRYSVVIDARARDARDNLASPGQPSS